MDQKTLETTGRIFNIQRYSIHDGPGIRTIVFLKGCPLRCRWCCNPESQSLAIQEMLTRGKREVVGRDVTVQEVLEEVMSDQPYYRRSGGGVTLSGGEALVQPDFATALLDACQWQGITTAVETTGFAPFETVERFLPRLDYVLMDIKHMDSGKHKAFTGQPNELILENARKIARQHPHLTIRTPVVPGFNDTPDEIAAIARFAASLPGVKGLHLLPYHRLGEGKYEGLGRDYDLKGVLPLDNERMQVLLEAAEPFGIRCQVGG